ncbi:PAC2 family protein [Rhodococcus sp. X156]|uniref:PAC2 family protein n=1 Tax=Rhodococcus sp. X156 TaxID=2499145 RepID=UPI0019CF9DC3|nr:PAC2 family protein [Rhodococcus sp. X156]
MTQTEPPRLLDPILVAAFEGWNDAGDAATGAVEHLELCWDATPLMELDSEDYYDFQVTRPTVRMVEGVTREIQWPATRLTVCRPPGSARDVVLLRGIEPNMRWRAFCAELIEVFDTLGVRTVVTLGALLADTAHTRPVPVTGSAYSTAAAKQFNLEQTRYEGPTGITGVLQEACVRAGVPAISFWAAVPHYVAQPPNPKATLALLHRVEEVLDVEVPLVGLPEQAAEWEGAVNEMAEEDEEVIGYVRALEERGDAETDMSEAVSQTDGEAIAAEFERYLRRRGPGSGP